MGEPQAAMMRMILRFAFDHIHGVTTSDHFTGCRAQRMHIRFRSIGSIEESGERLTVNLHVNPVATGLELNLCAERRKG